MRGFPADEPIQTSFLPVRDQRPDRLFACTVVRSIVVVAGLVIGVVAVGWFVRIVSSVCRTYVGGGAEPSLGPGRGTAAASNWLQLRPVHAGVPRESTGV